MTIARKECICCGETKSSHANFPRYMREPDTYSKTCRQCQKEIKDGTRKREPIAPAEQRKNRGSSGILLLDAVWAGYADWREATTARAGRGGNLRDVQPTSEVLHTLGTAAPQTVWRDR